LAGLGAWLAGFSYTLYVVHYPVVSFLHAALLNGHRPPPTLGWAAGTIGISLGLVLLYAYPVSLLAEARTDTIRRRISAWLRPQGRVPETG
jgi:peptidoglycan/LPS O-acetylase OafA/YrhL